MVDRAIIETLGGLQVRGSLGVVSDFGQRRATLLLARLVLARGKPVGRDTLADLLWPGDELEATRQRLRQALATLRARLTQLGPEVAAGIAGDRLNLWLDLGALSVDLLEFERLIQRASTEPDPIPLLRRALTLYQGELFSGLSTPWIERERVGAAHLRRQAAAKLARHLGPDPEALDTLRTLAEEDPCDEESWCEWIRLLAEAKHFAKALAAASDLRAQLRQQLDLNPSPETEELIEKIRAQARSEGISGEAPPKSQAKPLSHSVDCDDPLAAWRMLPDHFTAEAAAMVWPSASVMDCLEDLLTAGALSSDRTGPIVRYRVADTGQGPLPPPETQALVRRRTIDYAVTLARQADPPGLRGLRGLMAERFLRDIPLIELAVRWALEAGETETAVQIVRHTQALHTYAASLDSLLRMVAETLRHPIPTSDQAWLILLRAFIWIRRSAILHAREDLARSYRLWGDSPPSDFLAYHAYTLSMLAEARNRPHATYRWLMCAAERFDRADLPHEAIDATHSAAIYLFDIGRRDHAMQLLKSGLARADELHDDIAVGIGMRHLAEMYAWQGDLRAADQAFLDAARVFELAGDALGEAWVYGRLALHRAVHDDHPSAREALDRSLTLRRNLRDTGGVSSALQAGIVIFALAGDSPAALAMAEEAIRCSVGSREESDLSAALAVVAAVLVRAGKPEVAATLLGGADRLGANPPTHTFGEAGERFQAEVDAFRQRLTEPSLATAYERGKTLPRRLLASEIAEVRAQRQDRARD